MTQPIPIPAEVPRGDRSIENDAYCWPIVIVTMTVEVIDNDGVATTKVEQSMTASPDPRDSAMKLRTSLNTVAAEIVDDIVEHVDRTVQRTAWGR